MKRLLILTSLLLTGCAADGGVFGGGANYTYTNKIHADGSKECSVVIASAREVQGAGLEVDKDCSLTAGASKLDGIALRAVEAAVSKIP